MLVGILLLLVAVFLGWMAAKPRGAWWSLSSWQHRNPDANEPSDLSYGLSSVLSGLLAFGAVIAAIALFAAEAPADRARREEQAETRCEEVRERLLDVVEYSGTDSLDREVANPAEVEAAARDLGVEVDFERGPFGLFTVVDDEGELVLTFSDQSNFC